jgi:hypothetical protein
MPAHLKHSLPHPALAAQYEYSTRMLVLMFAEPPGGVAALGFYCFDTEYNKLLKQTEIRVPAVVRFSEHNTLDSQMPCVLLPASVSSDAAAATKVSTRLNLNCIFFRSQLQCVKLLLHVMKLWGAFLHLGCALISSCLNEAERQGRYAAIHPPIVALRFVAGSVQAHSLITSVNQWIPDIAQA